MDHTANTNSIYLATTNALSLHKYRKSLCISKEFYAYLATIQHKRKKNVIGINVMLQMHTYNIIKTAVSSHGPHNSTLQTGIVRR